MVYVYLCTACDKHVEHKSRTSRPFHCPNCGSAVTLKRDYRAEGVQVDRFAFKVGGTRYHRREPEGGAA